MTRPSNPPPFSAPDDGLRPVPAALRRPPPWCRGCRHPPPACICSTLPRLENSCHVVLIQHVLELDRQSNTGGILERLLASVSVVQYGRKDGDLNPGAFELPGMEYAVLFPVTGAPAIGPGAWPGQNGARRALVVVDATWRQARRMFRRIEALRGLPVVRLAPTVLPRWLLRNSHQPGAVSTLEAVAAAFAATGEESVASSLLEAYGRLAQRILVMRGKAAAVRPRRGPRGA